MATVLTSKRVQWMAKKLEASFGCDEALVEKCFKDSSRRINSFMADLTTPPKLLFFYQPKNFQNPELFISSGGEGDKLTGKCVYFIRNSTKPINNKIEQDNTVLCGETSSAILENLEITLGQIFTPLLKNQSEWGLITHNEDRKVFIDQLEKFEDDLKRKIRNLRGDVELRSPDSPFDKIEQKPAAYAKAARDKRILDHFQEIVESWCEQINKYKNDDSSLIPLDKSSNAGPDEEIEYWSRRMLSLISITEQLKTKPNRVVTGVLKQRALREEAESNGDETSIGELEKVKQLIESWREIDLAITDALNESKDNVRFLENLRKVIEPLYNESPEVIADSMPSLMNSMKMIHTLSRHYGTEVRMTNLFYRITNQLISRCKDTIHGTTDETTEAPDLWEQDPEVVISRMQASISLCEAYRKHYLDTKTKLQLMPKGKQFNFDETAIFGKFTRFRRRLEKLIDMFSSIQQFKLLQERRIDGMEKLIASFDTLINEFKLKAHDLLDFDNTTFERDFVEFAMKNSGLENAIQDFMGESLGKMDSIDKQLKLMAKFQSVLRRESLQEDLDHKYLTIFQQYGKDLHHIHHIYERFKTDPPISRNITRIAGNIYWARQLQRRISGPMHQFQRNPKVFHPKESKKIVKHHNKLVRVVIKFETLWHQTWQRSCDQAKQGLHSRLIVQDPTTGQLVVNFDIGVLQLMKQAKHLQLLGLEIPSSARIVLLLEDRLKGYHAELTHVLKRYNHITSQVPSVTRSLLVPHLKDLEQTIKPAMTTMTWASMNIGHFLTKLTDVLDRFQYLVEQMNDIIANRIEKNLYLVSRVCLLKLPADKSFVLREFSEVQRAHMAVCTDVLISKNEEVKRAVDDMMWGMKNYPLHPSIQGPSDSEVLLVKLHYYHQMHFALLTSTKNSLSLLKKRVSTLNNPLAGISLNRCLFEVDVGLQVPNVVLTPSLDEVQKTINSVAKDVLLVSKKIMDWAIEETSVVRQPKPFFDRLASDKNIAIVCILLTGAIEDSRRVAEDHLSTYNVFSWLWKENIEKTYASFVSKNNPVLEDFVAELHHFVDIEKNIEDLDSNTFLGSLNLRTEPLKIQLKHEVERWKNQYSVKLHEEVKRDMESLTDLMHESKSKLEREVKDFASLKFVMDAMSEIRDVQSYIDDRFDSITERYNTLETYLPFGVMSKDEMDAKSVLKTQWTEILTLADEVMGTVNQKAPDFKEVLITNVREFRSSVTKFREDYDENGPMVSGVAPQEAITRLAKYKREFETLNRKYELYNGGERLFGLREKKYPDLSKTKKELRLLDQLYSLYSGVITTVDEYKNIAWSEVVAGIQDMNDSMMQFSDKCKRLPKGLKTWPAYVELSNTIDDFMKVLPLLTELSKQSMRPRHWEEISKITNTDFDLEKFAELKLKTVLDADLLSHQEDIEEITDSAEKQLSIEKKLKDIQTKWESSSFDFASWKERGDVILSGQCVSDTVEQLEESQSSLVQMLTQRHVAPFRNNAEQWLKQLSDVNDTLEGWIKVQMLWMSLEAVFTGGDIARQMPTDTRVFLKVDKEWTSRLMNKAKDVRSVVDCCQNEYIKNMLPSMFIDLNKCQKALDGYLEAKRSKFPRFYFVSNPALLLILSQGSDKEAVQEAFPKIFDAIDRVEFQGNSIVKMRTIQAGFEGHMDSEDIPLTKPVSAKGNIEDWLNLLLKEMKRTLRDIVRIAANEYDAMSLPDFIEKYCAQVSLLGIQFMWTSDVQEALIRSKHEKSAMSAAFKKQMIVLQELSAMTTQEIPTKMDRTKVETLVTIQVHQRDVLHELVQKNKAKQLKDVWDFEWQKQLRCYWDSDIDHAVVRVCDVDFVYCYEYIGCKERLVVTPLTDRCYISLTQALGMAFGGAPAGPAGTGKTETVKDLGRGLGKLVVVFNCSDQMHTADTAKIYKGLCQSGSFGCFDEFNRIDLEVLSVVAQQVQAVFNAVRKREDRFTFPGETQTCSLDPAFGIFITMNPGYAGRQELPENLKALFRGVAMMVPDREIIIKVKLASVGYMDFNILSHKFNTCYRLCEEQLSKQKHYDFGLRNILSVLRTAGVNLRIELSKDPTRNRSDMEEMLLMRTLRDMNLSKLVADDVPLFISLLHDLFPNQDDPDKRKYDDEEEALRKIISDMKLVHHDGWVNKIIQLYETSLVRHGLMMVGPAGGGKTVAIRALVEALSLTHDKHQVITMSPKAIKAEEMFGQNDLISGEWTHGIFSSIWAKYNDIKKAATWIVCDGPVDAIWIENLNTVLDDNRLLTLANGDRIPMTDNVRILFEVENLRNASPATVSRAGIIFVSETDLGYAPIVQCWMENRREEEGRILHEIYDRFIDQPDLLDWLQRSTRNVMKATRTHLITNCLSLIEAILCKSVEEQKILDEVVLERIFLYSIIWSLGGLLEAGDRAKLSKRLCEICPNNIPQFENKTDTLYEYCLDETNLEWDRWFVPEWEYPTNFKFTTCLVPTVDSIRAEEVIHLITKNAGRAVLVVGSSGTAKTSIVLQYTNVFDASEMILQKVNFSSATTAGMFQTTIESCIEKRQGKTYAPAGGRLMTIFLDDMSMPEVNKWGDQPTLELVRQLVETKGFYFLEKDQRGLRLTIENIQFVGAMSHPGGGRNDIPSRFKRHFFTFNITPPAESAIDMIYGSMLRGQFDGSRQLTAMVPQLTGATIKLWNRMKGRMLPTPAKFHYIFNMRDLSRIFQGILISPTDVLASDPSVIIKLWYHECERVLCDKLVDFKDKSYYQRETVQIMTETFGENVAGPFLEELKETPNYFVDFLRDEVVDEETEEVLEDAPKIYEPGGDTNILQARVEMFLAKYNEEFSAKRMDLVLFKDAMEHMMRISRIIGRPRGNALLVGVGGSGRQSLTRLAAFIAKHEPYQIQLTRNFKMSDFLEDLRKVYIKVGKEGKKVTWIITDFEIIDENMLEYINAVLSTGEIAGLFPKDERDMMVSDLRGAAKKEDSSFEDTPDNLYKFFIDRIRDHLHVVLCFSPANEKFAERARRFPGLISGCTIDYFLPWPKEALVDVSTKFIAMDVDFKMDADDSVRDYLVEHIARVHNLIVDACGEYFQKFRRNVYVTPKSYLAFISSYKTLYAEKLASLDKQQTNVELGLAKLHEAEQDVERMKVELADQQILLQKADKEATAMLGRLEIGSKEANEKKRKADVIEDKCNRTAEIINAEKEIATKELEAAMPFVYAAEKAAKSINKKDISLIQKLPKPPDLIKIIMDTVLILNLKKLEKITQSDISVGKHKQVFLQDSYETHAKRFMIDSGFISTLLNFAAEEKDNINEETMELLEPYLSLPIFNPEQARSASSAAEGLCRFVMAMASYHKASLIVGPKLEQLQIKTNLYNVALSKLHAAQDSSARAQEEVNDLTLQFEQTMKHKSDLEAEAKKTMEKMLAANNLIKSLSGEKSRWGEDAKTFATYKRQLVGDCAIACAFVSYLGPFNFEFRKKLLEQYFFKDCIANGIPTTKNICQNLNNFLVDEGTVAEWNSQGLPKDELSIQNGILVTQASRFPLLVDPQGQAINWLKTREFSNFPPFGTTSLTSSKLRDDLEFCLEAGRSLVIESVVKDLDPMFDPILEKNFVSRGRSLYVKLGEQEILYDPMFRLYFITKLSNPLFSPELSAKTTIIDFSVTQKGLEDQLLSRVIQQEQKVLEEQKAKLVEEVNQNTIALQNLDRQLLERLSNSSGNLLDDVELIGVLAATKTKADDVKEKIAQSKSTEDIINKKREQYRPVATRGSVIYFVITAMSQVNSMYQTSLAMFLKWFDQSMVDAEPASFVATRVKILEDYITLSSYINIDRGLFESDKLVFKLMMTMKIQTTQQDGLLTDSMIQLFLKGGDGLSPEHVSKKPGEWLQDSPWMNICQIATSLDFFGDLKSAIEQNENEWKVWYESEAPEEQKIPRIEARLQSHPSGPFMRLLLIRCFRDDRTRLAANMYIEAVLGAEFVEPVASNFEELATSAASNVPIILLLTPGADPTSQLEELAKKKGVAVYSCSMGEGQEPLAKKCIDIAMQDGSWAVLQNCHLGLGFMNEIEDLLIEAHKDGGEVHENMRLWITCEPHKDFPINLLQMSIKVTNEPPRGMKAGLFRSYTSVVDSERLTRVDTKEWRDLVFTICFLHSAVQERRKFGPVGWSIPYEFNNGDLEASLTFLEKHCFAAGSGGLSWSTVQYMICEVQYGGRITDDRDRKLFTTFGSVWLDPGIMREDFVFFPTHGAFKYKIPTSDSLEGYKKFISQLPGHDSPEIFGLHSNADLTFGRSEGKYVLETIMETQPKETGGGKSGETREEIVSGKCAELLSLMSELGYVDEVVRSQVRKRPGFEMKMVTGETDAAKYSQIDGFTIPLNIFLYQEICRLSNVINNVRRTLENLIKAIKGEIIMTPQLQEALDYVYLGKPPVHWYTDASGATIAWTLPTLNLWFNGLIDREEQMTSWLTKVRPISYWMTGFFNPQGFLTAVRQEVTRKHKNDKWALDDVNDVTEVTDVYDHRLFKSHDNKEGVYVHGLFLEGCSWGYPPQEKKEKILVESHPKDLFTPLPVLYVTAASGKVIRQRELEQAKNNDGRKMWYYDCPVYTKPRRTDLAYVFNVKLKTDMPPEHWVLRGVALLCSID